jgi:GyrI-like small molecule binding domain
MKIALRAIALTLLIFAVYYFFFHPYEFKVNFSAKTLPGDIIQTIRIWNRSLDSAQIVEVDSFKHVHQRISIEGREYIYDWYFQLEDSVTNVSVHVSEPARKVLNKVLVPLSEPSIEKDGSSIVKRFYNVLKQHLEITNVSVIGEAKHDSEFCLCHEIEEAQTTKAYGMMKNYLLLSSFIEENGLKLAGSPSVRLKQWSHNQGKLKYDFCFPISPKDSLPVMEGLEYKHFDAFDALKAEYNGNYITSDRAWYALYHHANKFGYKLKGSPVEYFVDNPNFGMNEIQWKAEVFLPIEVNH